MKTIKNIYEDFYKNTNSGANVTIDLLNQHIDAWPGDEFKIKNNELYCPSGCTIIDWKKTGITNLTPVGLYNGECVSFRRVAMLDSVYNMLFKNCNKLKDYSILPKSWGRFEILEFQGTTLTIEGVDGKSVGEFSVYDCPNLTTIICKDDLYVSTSINIYNCPNLETIKTSVHGGTLRITNCDKLSKFDKGSFAPHTIELKDNEILDKISPETMSSWIGLEADRIRNKNFIVGIDDPKTSAEALEVHKRVRDANLMGKYKLNKNLEVVPLDGAVSMRDSDIKELGFQFADGDYTLDITYMRYLKTLKGSPKVCRHFHIQELPKLSTLEYYPTTLKDQTTTYIHDVGIKSLKGLCTKGVKEFYLERCNKLESFDVQFEKDMERFGSMGSTRLNSLKGSPQKCGVYSIQTSKALKNLQGAPTEVLVFKIINCPGITSLQGAPAKVSSIFFDRLPGITSLSTLSDSGEYELFEVTRCINLKEISKRISTQNFNAGGSPRLTINPGELKCSNSIAFKGGMYSKEELKKLTGAKRSSI